jgi:hypothetical protein
MGFLQRMFGSKQGRRIEHPVVGEALLIRLPSGPYWEIETEVARKAFSLAIEAPDEADPTPEQIAFFQRYANDPDLAFSLARALLVAEYARWVRAPFPAKWTDAFVFVGMSVPAHADSNNPWELVFECLQDRNRHLFTCIIKDGTPTTVQIDG